MSPTTLLSLYLQAAEESAAGIVICDSQLPDTPVIFVNAAFSIITGYAPAEVLGRNCRFLEGHETSQPGLDELRAAVTAGRECAVRLRNFRKDGSLFWNDLRLATIRNEAGKLTHYIGVLTDVSGQVAAGLAYRDATDKLRLPSSKPVSPEVERFSPTLLDQYETLDRLARAAESRDDNTGAHTHRVATTAALLARELGWPPDAVDRIERAAVLHDIGKIGISDAILLKPGRLTNGEFANIQTHTTSGGAILSGGRHSLLRLAESIALNHHERWDGSGYPQRLAGTEIPQAGRIVAVADVYDALTHKRPYKEAWSVEDAVAEIVDQADHQFDPAVVDAFVKLHKRGSLPAL